MDIEEGDAEVLPTKEEPDEIEEDETGSVDEATVTGVPEPKAPSSAHAPPKSNMVDVMDI